MAMHRNVLKSMTKRFMVWLRVFSDRRRILFGSFPDLRDAFGADGLPLSFILRRDSNAGKAGNGKRHNPVLGPVLKGVTRESNVYPAAHRVHVRSALRANADRRNDDRTA